MNSRLTVEDPEYPPLQHFVLDQLGKAPSLRIAELDEMYSLAESVSGSRVPGLLSYFRTGVQIRGAVRQIADWHFRSPEKALRLLDFDAGYGRATRFLATDFGPGNVWAAGIDADALKFLEAEFSVETVPSALKPEGFQPGMQWDCIFANSFFNRLTEVEFTRWLWKLHSLLRPGGLLIFAACDADAPVSLGFVHQAIIAVTGTLVHTRIPQGLEFTHDLLAISKGNPQTEPIQFQYGPNGCLDRCRWTEPYQMKLSGWAFEPTPGESIARVDVHYNNRLCGSGQVNHDRPDVAETSAKLLMPAPIRSGWDCVASLEGGEIRPSTDWMMVKAVSTSGREFVMALDHPSALGGFECMAGWEYNEAQGGIQAILPVKRFVDYPVNGRFTSDDTTLAGWVASPDADSLEQLSLIGRFGNVPYTLISRPDVYAEHHLHSLGFETTLPPEYLTVPDPQLRFVTRKGIVLATLETVVDRIAGS